MNLQSININNQPYLPNLAFGNKKQQTEHQANTTSQSVLYSTVPFKNANYLHFGHDIVKSSKKQSLEEIKQKYINSSKIDINKISSDSDTQETLEKLIELLGGANCINPFECVWGYQNLDDTNKATYKKLLELAENGKVSIFSLRGWNKSSFDKEYINNVDLYYKAFKDGLSDDEIADLFIPTVDSVEDGLSKCQTGKTFEANGTLYYKTVNNEAEKLDLDKKTFFNLFNPAEPVCQGFASDCWMLSPIVSMLDEDDTRIKLYKCFSKKDGKIEIKIPKSKTSVTVNENGDLPKDKLQYSEHYAQGQKGVRLLELAAEKELVNRKTGKIIDTAEEFISKFDLSENMLATLKMVLDDCYKNPTNPKYILYRYNDKEKELASSGDLPQPLVYWNEIQNGVDCGDYGIYNFEELQKTDFEKTGLFAANSQMFYRTNCDFPQQGFILLGQSIMDEKISRFSTPCGSPVDNYYNLKLFQDSTDYFITTIDSKFS